MVTPDNEMIADLSGQLPDPGDSESENISLTAFFMMCYA
jgi:hypothetical protein